MYYVPELVIPIISWVARKHNTLFAKPIKAVLEKAIMGADIVHIYQPWPLGCAAERIARRLGIPSIASFHVQPENITYNIGLGWFPLAAHVIYYLMYSIFYRRFSHIHCPSKFIAAQPAVMVTVPISMLYQTVLIRIFVLALSEKGTNTLFNVLMIGRLSAEKRQDVLIKAVQQSRNANRIQLYFAGQGPKERRLRRMGKKLPNPPIFGHYNKKELIELIRSCHLYVHASDVEIEGISCIEAFACGLVPIISDSKRSATRQFALGPMNLFRRVMRHLARE